MNLQQCTIRLDVESMNLQQHDTCDSSVCSLQQCFSMLILVVKRILDTGNRIFAPLTNERMNILSLYKIMLFNAYFDYCLP